MLDDDILSRPLRNVSDEDLCAELALRHSASLILLLNARPGNKETLRVAYQGGRYTCVGMAENFVHDALHGNLAGDGEDEDDDA